MIKALLLIFASSHTWERIARARRGLLFVLFLFLVPTIALSIAGEIAGRNYLAQGDPELRFKIISHDLALRYGGAELAAGLLVVFIGAWMFKTVSETFHNRSTYTQCFVAMAYATGPYYLFHLLDAIPQLNPWISFTVGIIFTFSALYYAVPHVIKPDPPHAFGLFLMGGIILTMLSVLARLFTVEVLSGNIKLL
jgi:hypothetical protein